MTEKVGAAGGAPGWNQGSVDELTSRIETFIRERVIPAEPRPGERLPADVRRSLQAEAKQAGLFAPHAPREFGGLGLDIRWWSPVFQAAGYSPIGPTVLNCMAPDEGNMRLLEVVGTTAQKDRYLAPLVAGDARSCFGMTEPHPGAGSDPAALQSVARRVDGGWIVDAHKRFISGALEADFCILMVRTDADEEAPAGATMFLIPMDTPGVRVGSPIHTIDRAIDGGHPHLHFESVFVPDDAVLGQVGLGFRYAQVRLGPARLTHCMRWLGLARRSLDIALDRAREREMFGSALQDLGVAQALIADSVIDIETTSAIVERAGRLFDIDDRAATELSSVAKVYSSEAIFRVIDRAMQLCGGDGVSDELPLAQFMNEVRPFRIYDGSNETHRWAIARRASKMRARTLEKR